MKKRHAILPTLGLIFSFAILVLGVVVAASPWTPELQTGFIRAMESHALSVTLTGISLFAIGIVLLSAFLSDSRRSYVHLEMGAHEVSIDEVLIRRYVDRFWKKELPEYPAACDVSVFNNILSISADVAARAEEFPQKRLNEIDTELSKLLKTTCGYSGHFHLSLRFDAEKTSQ